jgi:SNF2 family DNA or RNA helicase
MKEKKTPELWQHQTLAIEKAKHLNEFALLFEPGLGKTRTLLEILRHKFNENKKVEKTLIVAPGITLQNWRNEILQFTKIPQEKVLVLQGTGIQRIKQFALGTAQDENKIVICNYESISVMKKCRETLVRWKPKYVVADEMHKIKDYKSVRSVGMREVSAHSEFRYGLTGTAVLNNYMDLFGQWLWLDRGRTLGTNFFVFRGKFYLDKNQHMPRHIHFPKFAEKQGSADIIRDLIQPMSAKALKSECLDLPPLVKKKVFVDLNKQQAKAYKDMKDHMLTWMNSSDSAVVASTALTKVIRLMQISSGFVKTEDGQEILFDHSPKGEALHEILESVAPNKIIIWATFKRSYDVVRAVCAKLKLPMVECHGETTNANKFKNVDTFNNDPECKVFLGHPQSLGIGINLVAASYMVYFDRNFSLENDIQSEARNYRAGSEIHESVTRYDIIAKNTVDELCLTMLDKKSEVSASILKNWMELEDELNDEDGDEHG